MDASDPLIWKGGNLPAAAARIPGMTILPTRFGALALLSAALLPAASAQTTDSAHTDAKGRHLAPRDTFYLLSYVAVKTDKGVEGFDPGQEVHLVEVHRPTQTLVVTDGHAQVEVPPSKLTNDMDVAAMVRQKDEAKQAQVATYVQAEQEAYNKYEREAADATAKDLEHARDVQQQQAAEVRREEQAPVAQIATPTPVDASINTGGYYGDGGYGYGSPYGYFVNTQGTNTNRASTTNPAAAVSAGGRSSAPAANPATVGTAGKPGR